MTHQSATTTFQAASSTSFAQAWRVTRYGGPEVLEPTSFAVPTPPKGEVLIKIHASAVTRADGMMRAGTPKFARLFLGLGKPKQDRIGTGISGVVQAVGTDVTQFKVGDEIFGETGLRFGGNASHICLPEDYMLVHKSAQLSHAEAAGMCDGPLTSFNFLSQLAQIRPNDKVLILGASGSLGTAAVQIAAALGAQVTGTCSTRNTGLVASLGAHHVIDYTDTDFTRDTRQYDVIYDTLGVSNFDDCKPVLTRTGRYLSPVLGLGLLCAMLRSIFTRKKAQFSATGMLPVKELRPMMAQILDLVAQEKLRPVMDRSWPLSDLPEAHSYVETGRKRGNVTVS